MSRNKYVPPGPHDAIMQPRQRQHNVPPGRLSDSYKTHRPSIYGLLLPLDPAVSERIVQKFSRSSSLHALKPHLMGCYILTALHMKKARQALPGRPQTRHLNMRDIGDELAAAVNTGRPTLEATVSKPTLTAFGNNLSELVLPLQHGALERKQRTALRILGERALIDMDDMSFPPRLSVGFCEQPPPPPAEIEQVFAGLRSVWNETGSIKVLLHKAQPVLENPYNIPTRHRA